MAAWAASQLPFLLPTQGCTRGRHSNEKPQEPLRPEVSSEKAETKQANGDEIIYQGPKSAEALQRDRPRCVDCYLCGDTPKLLTIKTPLNPQTEL